MIRPAVLIQVIIMIDRGSCPRSRIVYAVAAGLVIGAGLLWRSHLVSLPLFLSKYSGDALWALMVFCGFGCIFNRISTPRLALISLAFSWGIEFSQLYHAPWIEAVRSHRLGHLVLGDTFNVPDLFAYAVGIALGAAVDRLCCGAKENAAQNEPR